MNELISDNIKNTISDWLQTGSINIFGMPMAGKDTQGERLGLLLNAPVIGGGDILRNSTISQNIQEALNSGELIPTDEYLKIMLPYFQRAEFEGSPIILSSVGRWLGEETSVLNAAAQAGHPIKAAIFLELSEEVAISRLSKAHRNRKDDDEEILGTRFAEFNQKTRPVIEVYREKGLLIEIDGAQQPDDVTKIIFESLQTFIKDKRQG